MAGLKYLKKRYFKLCYGWFRKMDDEMECSIVKFDPFVPIGATLVAAITFSDGIKYGFRFEIENANVRVEKMFLNPATLIAKIGFSNGTATEVKVSDTNGEHIRSHYHYLKLQTQQKQIMEQIQDVKDLLNLVLSYSDLVKNR